MEIDKDEEPTVIIKRVGGAGALGRSNLSFQVHVDWLGKDGHRIQGSNTVIKLHRAYVIDTEKSGKENLTSRSS